MAGNLPATGSALSFGRVNQAYTTYAPGAGASAPSGGTNIRLSAVLGASATYGSPSKTAGTQISFAAHFSGRFYPYTY
jgi:hypothetical protein